jgi:hypothetical protein
MKPYLYSIALAVTLLLEGCSQAEPEPDFSGIQNIPYTVQQFSGTTGGAAHVSIHPNPFFEQLEIYVHNPDRKPATIYISDQKGKYSRKIDLLPDGSNNYVLLDFQHMPKGVYICEVQHPGKADRYRLVKAR